MFLSEPKKLILNALRHGPLDQFQLGADTQLAPYYLRAELRGGLRRERLVREVFTGHAHRWELTDRGWAQVLEGDQLELGPAA